MNVLERSDCPDDEQKREAYFEPRRPAWSIRRLGEVSDQGRRRSETRHLRAVIDRPYTELYGASATADEVRRKVASGDSKAIESEPIQPVCTPKLTLGCLATLVDEVDAAQDKVVVVDNDSADGSHQQTLQGVQENG